MLPLKLKILAAVAAAAAAVAVAQPTTEFAGTLYSVTHVVIKADHVATYRDYLKKASDGYKKAGSVSFSVYQGVMGNPLEYMLVRQVANYAALDEGSPLAKAYAPAEMAAINSQRDQCTESARITYERGVFAVGGGTPRKYRILTRFRSKPTMAAAYSTAITSELGPAMAKVDGMRWRVRRVEWGGSRADFALTNDVETLASLDQPSPTTRALGAEKAAAWNKKLADIGTPLDAMVYRFLPELSFGRMAAPAATR
jgi:hypothetical protein